MNDLGSDFSKSYLIYIEECLGTFYSKHPSGPHLPLCRAYSFMSHPLPKYGIQNTLCYIQSRGVAWRSGPRPPIFTYILGNV